MSNPVTYFGAVTVRSMSTPESPRCTAARPTTGVRVSSPRLLGRPASPFSAGSPSSTKSARSGMSSADSISDEESFEPYSLNDPAIAPFISQLSTDTGLKSAFDQGFDGTATLELTLSPPGLGTLSKAMMQGSSDDSDAASQALSGSSSFRQNKGRKVLRRLRKRPARALMITSDDMDQN